MDNDQRRQVIEHYIQAYNNFDVDGMIRDLHNDILFENVVNGSVNLATHGLEAFRDQAESAKSLFRSREQKISGMQFRDDVVEALIDYTGVFAADLPNGPKAGDAIQIRGKSIFTFRDGKIAQIRDES
jgi:ketosteroid isomerase-like protein